MKGLVLLSGGLDSAVNLAYAVQALEIELCLTADYGQVAAGREIFAAKSLASHYGLQHTVVGLPFFKELAGSALFNPSEIPEPEIDRLDDPEHAAGTARAVWVPNRNGVLISVAAAYAEALGLERIVVGFNKEEAATFPDNSAEFVQATNAALRFSTLTGVGVISYTARLDKAEIVALGNRLGVPWHLIWSCYRGGEKPCGTCESCLRLARAAEKRRLPL